MDGFSLYRQTLDSFAQAGISYASEDAGAIFAHVCGHNSVYFPEKSFSLTPDQADKIADFVARRCQREPLGRILGTVDFYGLTIKVTMGVFRPCSDVQNLIDHALLFFESEGREPQRILDLGTGSGCLLLALLKHYPKATGVGVDHSELSVLSAKENAILNGLSDRAHFQLGNWTEGLTGLFDLIITNPPSVPSSSIEGMIPEFCDHEPLPALDGGRDGLDFYRRIASSFQALTTPDGVGVIQIYNGEREASFFRVQGLSVQIDSNYRGQPNCLYIRHGETKKLPKSLWGRFLALFVDIG